MKILFNNVVHGFCGGFWNLLSQVTSSLVLKEKLLILSWETCRWVLSSLSWRSWHASSCSVFKCAFFVFLSVIPLWSPPFLVSPPSLFSKKELGNFWIPRTTLSYTSTAFSDLSSVLNKLSERNGVFSEIWILLSIQLYATDSAYCKSFLVDKMYRLY